MSLLLSSCAGTKTKSQPSPALSKLTAWGEDGVLTGTQKNSTVRLAGGDGQGLTTWPEGVLENLLEKMLFQVGFKDGKSQPSAGRGWEGTPGIRASLEARGIPGGKQYKPFSV